MNYGEKLRELRKKLGYTQVKMAEVLNVKQTSVSTYESNECYPCGRARSKYLELAKSIRYPLKLEELVRE